MNDYKAASMPAFTMLLLISLGWQSLIDFAPFIVKFGVLALLGALVSGLMAKDGDIRGSVRKGCAAIILGTVLPMFANLWGYDNRVCYVVAFVIGLFIDVIYPYLRKWTLKMSRKATKID